MKLDWVKLRYDDEIQLPPRKMRLLQGELDVVAAGGHHNSIELTCHLDAATTDNGLWWLQHHNKQRHVLTMYLCAFVRPDHVVGTYYVAGACFIRSLTTGIIDGVSTTRVLLYGVGLEQ